MPTSPLVIQQNDPKKLVEYLLSDLRALSTEARKKHNHIKEAAESGLVKVRNISSSAGADNTGNVLLQGFRTSCTEVLHPFLLGCSSKNIRLVQISLQSIQRLLQFQAVDRNAVPGIVNELWQLTEAECEELKVLQTIALFVGQEMLVTDWALAKCIVLAFRLNFSKDSSVVNAASAAVRQIFSCVFERVIQEDGIQGDAALQILPQQTQQKASQQPQNQQKQQTLAPPTLRPAAADAFLLLRDLCTLIRREQPNWLIGVQRITPILALELLEAVVKNYPSIFYKHIEFSELLKAHICAQIIKMVIGERELALTAANNNNGAALTTQQQQQQNPQHRPLPVSAAMLNQQHFHQHPGGSIVTTKARDFPIMVRALRICLAMITNYHSLLGPQNEVIIHFLLELLNHPSTSWEAAVSIEVIHKILGQPNLLSWLCARQDGSKFIELIFSRLATFVRKCLEEAALEGPSLREENFAQSGFLYKGVFLPVDEHQLLSAKRSILLDWLDRHSAEKIPEAYCLSQGFATLVDATHSIWSAIEAEHSPTTRRKLQLGQEDDTSKGELETEQQQKQASKAGYTDQAKELFLSTYGYLLVGHSTLLECSMDDSINEQLLNCLCSLVTLACRLGLAEAKHATLKTICQAALPNQYFSKFIEFPSMLLDSPGSSANGSLPAGKAGGGPTMSGADSPRAVEPTQVVAMGTVCPSPHLPSHYFNTSVMTFTHQLTAKNLQVARLLISATNKNGQLLGDCWEMALTAIQHFVWIIGLRPTSSGSFRAGGETNPSVSDGGGAGGGISTTSGASSSGASNVILTTAASSELPDLNQQLNALFESSTQQLDEVSLHHVIAALCKLSNENMAVSQLSQRETSFFSIAKLLQTALANAAHGRLHIFWRPVTAHLLELCAHSNAGTREWGAVSLTQLVKNAMKQTVAMLTAAANAPTSGEATSEQVQVVDSAEITKREQMILNPLCAMSEIDFLDVRAKQLDCLMRILEAESRPLEAPLWPMVIQIVTAIVAPEAKISDPQLIDQGFRALSIVVKEFLAVLPFDCVEMLIETDALYGQQQLHLNVSLASIGQLWDISDFVRRETSGQQQQHHGKEEVEHVWLVIYHALGRLCVDARPPVRKSACDTLLQTVAAHGQALGTQCWAKMLTEILFPMLDRVRQITQTASTQRSNTNSLGAPNLMIHHSRDTESKQWSETSVKTLGGVIKIFNAQRSVLIQIENFADCWAQLLRHIELAAMADNAEMSLAALKNLQELLFGRQQQTESSERRGNRTTSGQSKMDQQQPPDFSLAPPLPEPLWMVSWASWFRVSQAIASSECPAAMEEVTFATNTAADGQTPAAGGFVPTIKKHYVPGHYHLATLLDIFLWLFHRVRQQVLVDDFRQIRLGQIFQEIAAIPMSPDQALLSAVLQQQSQTAADQQPNMAQECLLNCVKTILQEQMNGTSSAGNTISTLRAALPDMLRLLLSFAQFAWQSPSNKFTEASTTIAAGSGNNQHCRTPSPNLVTFGELSLKMLLEFYTRTANFEEVRQQIVLVDIVKKLGEPLALKYRCPSQSTWQLAATTLNKICQIGFPIAREHVNLFKQLWPSFADTVEGFLFSSSKSSHPLNSDERKRHEFLDCLLIELTRTELLPHATKLPRDFMQRIIDILNRGSINTMDPNDVMASDVHQQRTDLSRVCFDALLSLSQMENPATANKTSSTHHQQHSEGILRNTSQSTAACSSLGSTAIASLLNRCRQVLNDYARDEQSSGHFRLPQERIFETISALRAVTALIEGFSKNPNPTLYSHLVTLHPSLVQLIPASRGDQQVELALMTCFHSYQTLLLLNLQCG